MNCYFCQNDPIENKGIYECHSCPLLVRYVINGMREFPLYSLRFELEVKEHIYEVYFNMSDPNHHYCIIYEMFYTDTSILPNIPMRIRVIELSFIPPLTPSNAKQKLPIYLTFS